MNMCTETKADERKDVRRHMFVGLPSGENVTLYSWVAECTDGRIHVLAESPSGDIVTLGNMGLALPAADPDAAEHLIACMRMGCGQPVDPNLREVTHNATA